MVLERYWDRLSRVDQANAEAKVQDEARSFVADMGFDQIGFAIQKRPDVTDPASRYKYFHNIAGPYGHYRYEVVYRRQPESDPILQHLQAGLPATAFSCRDGLLLPNEQIQSRYRGILHAAKEHGISAGVGVPISGADLRWGLMVATTGRTEQAREVRDGLPHLCLLAHHVYCRLRRFETSNEKLKSLTRRQSEILKWASLGKSSWEIGRILTISEATVNFHVTGAARKLGVSGRRAACARAIALKLIEL